jgi:hypothetical protein
VLLEELGSIGYHQPKSLYNIGRLTGQFGFVAQGTTCLLGYRDRFGRAYLLISMWSCDILCSLTNIGVTRLHQLFQLRRVTDGLLDLCQEPDFGWVHGVLFWQIQLELEYSACPSVYIPKLANPSSRLTFVWGRAGTSDSDVEMTKIVLVGCGRDSGWGVVHQTFSLLLCDVEEGRNGHGSCDEV